MQKADLLATLQKLERDLEETTDLDNETRRSLHTLIGDIQQKLALSAEQTADATEDDTLSKRLLHAVAEFEVQHPQLTATLSQLVDRLADMGI